MARVLGRATGVLLLFLVFAIPRGIAFLDHMNVAFELFILIWFTVDIVLSFVTPYEKAGLIDEPEMDRV